MLTSQIRNYRASLNEGLLQAELDLLEEGRLEMTIRNAYRKRIMRDYNKRVWHRDFKVGGYGAKEDHAKHKEPR